MALVVKNLSANAGDARDVCSIPGSGRFPGGGNGTPLQYSCLENLMDRGAWRATVRGVTKSWTRLKQLRASLVVLLQYDLILTHHACENLISKHSPILRLWKGCALGGPVQPTEFPEWLSG